MKQRRSIPFKIYLTPEENQRLQARVDAAGLSRSQYGHLVLTSPFVEQLQRAEAQDNQQRDLCLLLGRHYLALSLIESHLSALLAQPDPSACQPLVEQFEVELQQIKAEIQSLAQWLRAG